MSVNGSVNATMCFIVYKNNVAHEAIGGRPTITHYGMVHEPRHIRESWRLGHTQLRSALDWNLLVNVYRHYSWNVANFSKLLNYYGRYLLPVLPRISSKCHSQMAAAYWNLTIRNRFLGENYRDYLTTQCISWKFLRYSGTYLDIKNDWQMSSAPN